MPQSAARANFALGGLNYQIEHHLFPAMPSVNLNRAQPIVEQFCKEKDIAYHATGLWQSWREALTELHAHGEPLRNRVPAKAH